MIIRDNIVITIDEKIRSRKVVLEKTPNGRESMKITVKAPVHRWKSGKSEIKKGHVQQLAQAQPFRPVATTDQTSVRPLGGPRTFKQKIS
jgi:hypothetical protein